MNPELYSAICEEMRTLYGHVNDYSTCVLADVNIVNGTYYYALSQVTDYQAKRTLDWLKAQVNNKIFNAEGVIDPNAQGRMEL